MTPSFVVIEGCFANGKPCVGMSARQEFDSWAADGRDKGMEERHWHTAKHALARMPVEEGETVVDLGTGSGYALRALHETKGIAIGLGLDASPEMLKNARDYTDTGRVGFLRGDFDTLPFATNSVDHIWSMEAIYYAQDPVSALSEVKRILRPGGTFFCAVNFFEESQHTHEWQEFIEIDMTLWNRQQYREAFRSAGLFVAEQDTIPDREISIPAASEFPIEDWDSRDTMVDRYRDWGTLLTVGVAPE